MFRVLLKKQFTEIFKSYFYNPKNNTGRSGRSTVVMFIIFGAAMVFGLGGMFTMLSVALCASLHAAGADWLYFKGLAIPGVPISAASLMRRFSVVITFVLGAKFFHETNLRRKAVALALILAGVVLLCRG